MIRIIEGQPEDANAVIEFTKEAGAETNNLTFGAERLEVTLEQEALAGKLPESMLSQVLIFLKEVPVNAFEKTDIMSLKALAEKT